MNPRRYLILLFALVVPFMALHLAGMFWYLSDPLAFYRREWEYFLDIGDFGGFCILPVKHLLTSSLVPIWTKTGVCERAKRTGDPR